MSDSCEKKIPDRGNKPFAVSLLEWVELFVLSLTAVLLVVTFLVRHSPVDGTSMNQTLQDKDILLVSDLFYTPKCGDIVVVQSERYGYDTPLVKRVIARGGDTLDIDFDTWTVTVNGEVVSEPYVYHPITDSAMYRPYGSYNYPITVPEGKLFVMGDNRNGSSDSRDSRIGLIDERLVIGHVLCRVFPFDTAAWLVDDYQSVKPDFSSAE